MTEKNVMAERDRQGMIGFFRLAGAFIFAASAMQYAVKDQDICKEYLQKKAAEKAKTEAAAPAPKF